MNIYKTVTNLLGDITSADPYDMRPGFRLSPENGIAPIDVARLAIACEKKFRIPLYDEKIAEWETLGDVCAHLERLLEEGLAEPLERTDRDRTGWYYE